MAVRANKAQRSGVSGPSDANGVPAKPERGSGQGERDVALICGVSGDGEGLDIIRKRGDRLEAGTVRRLEQGKPIHGEVVRLRPRENAPLLCDVEVEFAARQTAPPQSSSGPAQVATESYRKNWEAIYGRKKQRALLN